MFKNLARKKIIILLLTTLLIIFLLILNVLFSENKKPNISSEQNSVKTYYNHFKSLPKPTIPITASSYDYYLFLIDSDSLNINLISYFKDNKIYFREIMKNNSLGNELIVAQNLPDIVDYVITKDKKFLIYSYSTGNLIKGNGYEGGGDAHNVDLLNIKTGEVKNIYNYNPQKGQIITLTLSPHKNIVFIGTDYKQLFLYDINSDKLTDITYSEDINNLDRSTFCIGYNVFDQSPDLSHILLKSYCYEGTNYYLYNINTKERINLGYSYGSGPSVKKFIENGSILIENHNDGYIVNVGKYNYQHQLVQELPLPVEKSFEKNQKTLYYHFINRDDGKEYYFTSEAEIINNKGDLSNLVKNNQFLGKNISLLKVIN